MKTNSIVKKEIQNRNLEPVLFLSQELKITQVYAKKLLSGSKPFTLKALKKLECSIDIDVNFLWENQKNNPVKSRKKESTPIGKINAALRALFLRSRERAKALKLAQNTCECCGAKRTKTKNHEVKLEVHHRNGIKNWNKIYELIYEELLCSPELLQVLCSECHNKTHSR